MRLQMLAKDAQSGRRTAPRSTMTSTAPSSSWSALPSTAHKWRTFSQVKASSASSVRSSSKPSSGTWPTDGRGVDQHPWVR